MEFVFLVCVLLERTASFLLNGVGMRDGNGDLPEGDVLDSESFGWLYTTVCHPISYLGPVVVCSL